MVKKMALIKCRECGKVCSDQARICPHCGIENNVLFCPECGKKISMQAVTCPNCGYSLRQTSSNVSINTKGNLYGLGLASVCLAGLSLFLPIFIFPIISFVMGIVTYCSNSGLRNNAKRLEDIGIAISIVSFLLIFVRIAS